MFGTTHIPNKKTPSKFPNIFFFTFQNLLKVKCQNKIKIDDSKAIIEVTNAHKLNQFQFINSPAKF